MFTKAKEAGHREPAAPQTTAIPRKTPRSAPSIVSADMTIVGAITAGGDIQVDGTVEGDIITDSLTVGENAMIKGEVLAEEVIVRGVVQGSIKAEKVQLCAGARVHGDILHAALAVETGALFEGNCRHSDDPLGRKSDSPKTDSVARMETGPMKPANTESSPPPVRTQPAFPDPELSDEEDAEESRHTEPVPSPAARFRPEADSRQASGTPESNRENGAAPKSPSSDLGKISPGRMRAGTEGPAPAANTKPK